MSKDYLLEIGTEEIPARFVKGALLQLNNKLEEIFKEEKLNYSEIKVYSTPRRLTAIVTDLDDRQEDEKKQVKGPSKAISYKDGKPTKALLGFMKGQNINEDNIVIKEIKGEDYIFANIFNEGKPVEEILKEYMPKLIRSIRFPESMKWGGKNLRFIRPIRWIVSLLDTEVVKFDLEGIKVSNETNGHRFLGNTNIKIDAVKNYENILRDNYVIIDQNERKEIILYESEKLAREVGGRITDDELLLDEVTNLVEYPTPIMGRIKDEFLKLPEDVVITPMKEHLRYSPLFDDNGRLLPYFITVRNGDDRYLDTVIKGNEKVLGARLEDARFFFEVDTKKKLEDYVNDLRFITFQDKLGSMYDKTIRIVNLSEKICDYLAVGENTTENVKRAAYLSKADLVTQMVTEFTELQGNIGYEYAKLSGESDIVSQAIYEQYLPRFAGDKLPETTTGAILGIADKLDSIAGLFSINIHPTGSQDPFALRRNAIGIINTIIDRRLFLSLNELIDFSLYIYVEKTGLAFDYNEVKDEILNFLLVRAKNLFIEQGYSYDIIDAILSLELDDLYDISIRIEKLDEWIKKDDALNTLGAFNRIANLADKAESTDLNKELMGEHELKLYEAFKVIEEKLEEYINNREYDLALDLFKTLKVPIDNFFDNVMVMDKNEDLRNNRLALVKNIHNMMLKVSDLSKIVR